MLNIASLTCSSLLTRSILQQKPYPPSDMTKAYAAIRNDIENRPGDQTAYNTLDPPANLVSLK